MAYDVFLHNNLRPQKPRSFATFRKVANYYVPLGYKFFRAGAFLCRQAAISL